LLGPVLMARRDIVVVGGSAGGVEALRRIVAALPGALPAAVFVVVHVSPHGESHLPEILARAGPLPASHPVDGEPVEPGRIYVAPPDMHLILREGRMRLRRGPRENRHRPAIDPLFRSAAEAFGPRVVGVVLSGALDDGTAGLIAVKIAGGVTVVQDPAEAFAADMPRNAMKYLAVDHVLPAREIGALVTRLVREDAGRAAPAVSEESVQERRLSEFDMAQIESDDRPGKPSGFSCPDCGGVLWELDPESDLLRFRCRVGHAYAQDNLTAAQADEVERALWTALRALEERAAMARRVATQARERDFPALAGPHEERALEAEAHAAKLREVLLTNTK
jgi:two-component system chemotaxis response regulator CheB